MTVPLPKSAFPVAGLCHPLPGMVPATDTAGDMLGWPPRTSSSRVLAAEQAGEGLPQEQGQMPKPTDTNAEALGQEEEAATQQLPALQLSACSGPEVVPGVVSSTAGMGWATLVGAKGQCWLCTASSSAVALRKCQLCLMDNKDHATAGSREVLLGIQLCPAASTGEQDVGTQ